jgi:DNA-binding response OmpR family regulator
MAKKVLVVEDDSTLAQSLSKALKTGGFEVFVSNDGESGFKAAQEKKPDLIILDLVLPKKHGFKVMEDLKSHPELSLIPVIVLTNLETPHDIERASSLGVKAYLVKANYSLNEILKRVHEILDED